ncbi:MAG: 30S ribosomal protein S6, partial [Undibacterium sp.]
MELYESLFIIRPSVSDEETKTLIEKMKGVADKTGAQFIKAENLGKKKLAYEVLGLARMQAHCVPARVPLRRRGVQWNFYSQIFSASRRGCG